MEPKAPVPLQVQQAQESELGAEEVVVSVLLRLSLPDRPAAAVVLRAEAAPVLGASLPAVSSCPMCLGPLDQSCVAVQP